jgi:hypothetical protein
LLSGFVEMLITQWTAVAARTSEHSVPNDVFASDVAKLLLHRILNDDVTARGVTVADTDGPAGSYSPGDSTSRRHRIGAGGRYGVLL